MRIAFLSAFIFAFASAVPSLADQHGGALDIKEWNVPWEGTRPRDPYAVRATAVRFGADTNTVGRLALD